MTQTFTRKKKVLSDSHWKKSKNGRAHFFFVVGDSLNSGGGISLVFVISPRMAGLSEILEAFSMLFRLRTNKPSTCDTVVCFKNVLNEPEVIEFRMHSTALMSAPYLIQLLTEEWIEARTSRITFDVTTMFMHSLVTRDHIELVMSLMYRDHATVDSLSKRSAEAISSPDGPEGEKVVVRMIVLLEFSLIFGFSLLTGLVADELCTHANTSLFNYIDALCEPRLARTREMNLSIRGTLTEKERLVNTELQRVHAAYLKRASAPIIACWEYPSSNGSDGDSHSHIMNVLCRLNINAISSLVLTMARNIPSRKLVQYAFHAESFGERRVLLCNVDAVLEEVFFEYLTQLSIVRREGGEMRALANELAELVDYATWKRFLGGHLLSLDYMRVTNARSTSGRSPKSGIRVAIVIYHSSTPPVVSSFVPGANQLEKPVLPVLVGFDKLGSMLVSIATSGFHQPESMTVLEWTPTPFKEQENPGPIAWPIHKSERTLLHGSLKLQEADVNVLYFGIS